MRHWRNALTQIYEYHATKTTPGVYGLQTDTEVALTDALKELELQCKERIDLLEALRASRRDPPQPESTFQQSKKTQNPEKDSRGKASIGQGTIPAVTYSELSRPILPGRPAPLSRILSDNIVLSTSRTSTHALPSPSSSSGSRKPSAGLRQDKAIRSPSPEKHTMRTTLRSGKLGDKPGGPVRKTPKPAAEGPSKAATLAWSALGSRDRSVGLPQSTTINSKTAINNPPSTEKALQSRPSQLQWDSNLKKLVSSREAYGSSSDNKAANGTCHSIEYPYSRPSYLSVSAASSALISSSNPELSSGDLGSLRIERQSSPRIAQGALTPLNAVRDGLTISNKVVQSTGELFNPTSTSGLSEKGKIFLDRSHELNVEKKSKNRSPRRRKPKDRKACLSSGSDENLVSMNNSRLSTTLSKNSNVGYDTEGLPSEETSGDTTTGDAAWGKKKLVILKNLPLGVDDGAAKQILNDIIVQGDKVNWNDIAGLEIAKAALRETVVYPFLRPDLFMGLREPARGMLLFGPPGTGKTMLARAVATESKSTFFSISASSLTSKYLGESEKLVRALFGLAKALAPSIIFVDEIDSLLSQRSGSGEHETSRRIKTEFLIQWSDLQRAAAGRETSERDKERGDANRVLVLAATNLPWAIDEAARRRFVRRQYIPLPEPSTRETQLRTLLGQQKHNLSDGNIERLVELTDGMPSCPSCISVFLLLRLRFYSGFSGSDITALAKDAAMGPLRSLGEALLHMTMDDIRPIELIDFEASLGTIRPSVNKAGLKEYEDWSKEYGERGG